MSAARMTTEEEIAMYRARPRRRRTPKPILPRKCAWEPCGQEFTPAEKRDAKYCSKSCGMCASHSRGDRLPEGGSLADRAKEAGLRPGLVYDRRIRGWSTERALSTPAAPKGSRSPNSNFGGWR